MWQKFTARLEAWQAAERGRFTLWLPVFMGAGILGYFALRVEPPLWLGCCAAVPAICGAVLLRARPAARGLALALAAMALGFAVGQFATARAPPLAMLPTHATILTGTVSTVEMLPAGRRITLEAAHLDDGPALTRWLRVRLRKDDTQDVATRRYGQAARAAAAARAAGLPRRMGSAT